MIELQTELDKVTCNGEMKRWRKAVAKGSRFYHYFWKCPCGKGMRYASHNAMYDGSLKHKADCKVLDNKPKEE